MDKPCSDCVDGKCTMNCGPAVNPHEGEWGWEGYRPGIDYPGRPDNGGCADWGCTYAKKFLPYVHSTSHNAMLIHKVARVRIRWYEGNYCYMRRLSQPTLMAETVCGMYKYIGPSPRRMKAKMCEIPDPNAVLCGRCHGELPTFSKRRTVRIKKQWAKDHLGCKGIVEVIGPYVPPEIPGRE